MKYRDSIHKYVIYTVLVVQARLEQDDQLKNEMDNKTMTFSSRFLESIQIVNVKFSVVPTHCVLLHIQRYKDQKLILLLHKVNSLDMGVKTDQSSKYNKSAYTCLLCSILVNIFFSYNFFLSKNWSLSWSTSAAAEAEAVASISCSGHGRAYLDGVVVDGKPVCECNTCYDGPDCSNYILDCPSDVNR